MKNIFDYTKNTILHGMPAGNLVVKSPIDYDIGGWSYKTYDSEDNIRENLRNKWCSTIINLFIFDKDIQFEHVKNFIESNLYEKHGRHSYLIYCLAVPKSISLEVIQLTNLKQKFISDTYSNQFYVDDYVVYVNDFVKNITLL